MENEAQNLEPSPITPSTQPPQKPPRSRRLILWIGSGITLFIIGFFILFIMVPQADFTDGLQNLSSIKRLSASKNEQPSIDGKNLANPDYTSFLKRDVPGFFTQQLNDAFGFLRVWTPAWSVSYFKNLLRRVTKVREKKRYQGYFVHKIAMKEEAQVVVIGDLLGAFHSLVRNLEKLYELRLIDNQLRLTRPEYFIVFLGDVVGRSPYCMVTLSIILKLMEQNPDQVFYLTGALEMKDRWKKFGFPNELKIRGQGYSLEKIPFNRDLTKFFATLPRAVFLQTEGRGVYDVVRISYFDRSREDVIDERFFSRFLRKKGKNMVGTHRVDERHAVPIAMESNIRCIINSEKKRKAYRFYDGVRLLAPDRQATAWAVLSCPTALYQQALNFYTDSFAIVKEHGKIKTWTMTQFVQDSRKKDGFKQQVYDLLSGAVVAGKGVKEREEAEELKKAEPGEEDIDVITPRQFARRRAAQRRRIKAKKQAQIAKRLAGKKKTGQEVEERDEN